EAPRGRLRVAPESAQQPSIPASKRGLQVRTTSCLLYEGAYGWFAEFTGPIVTKQAQSGRITILVEAFRRPSFPRICPEWRRSTRNASNQMRELGVTRQVEAGSAPIC